MTDAEVLRRRLIDLATFEDYSTDPRNKWTINSAGDTITRKADGAQFQIDDITKPGHKLVRIN